MATAITIKRNIAKLEAALKSKATPKSLKSKLETQLVKSKAELSALNKGSKPKTSSTNSTKTTLQKLKSMVNKDKKYKNYKGAGVDLEKDADRPALRIGKRTAKKSGKTYYEYRANRIDVKQPSKTARYPKLEKGGYMAKGGLVVDKIKEIIDENGFTSLDEPIIFEKINKDEEWLIEGVDESGVMITKYVSSNEVANNEIEFKDLSETQLKNIYKSLKEQGGYMAKGGKLKIGGDDFSFLLELSDEELSKRLDLVRKQQNINGEQYFEAKGKNQSTQKIEESRKNLDNQEKAIIEARLRLHDKKVSKTKMAKGGRMDDFSDKIQEGDIVWDSGNKRYGVVLNTYDFKYGEIRLDSDGNQPEENLHKLGSEGDKGTKEKLKEALLAHKSLITKYPEMGYDKVNYAKGGALEHGLKVGDTIRDVAEDTVAIYNIKDKKSYVVDLDKGERKDWMFSFKDKKKYAEKGGYMAKGGVSDEVYTKGYQKYRTEEIEFSINYKENGKIKEAKIKSHFKGDAVEEWRKKHPNAELIGVYEQVRFSKKEQGGYMADGGEVTEKEVVESNAQMVLSNIKEVKHHADELSNVVSKKSNIEAWVVAKIERASTDLSDITHYLEGQHNKMAMGGEIHRTQE